MPEIKHSGKCSNMLLYFNATIMTVPNSLLYYNFAQYVENIHECLTEFHMRSANIAASLLLDNTLESRIQITQTK